MDMEKAWEATQKITAAYEEDKYTDKEGLVWLGIEGDTRDEDHWLREDALESMSSPDMMKKMIYELMHCDETPGEDPYEYALQAQDSQSEGGVRPIKEDEWGTLEAARSSVKDFQRMVKRRKAGRIEDV